MLSIVYDIDKKVALKNKNIFTYFFMPDIENTVESYIFMSFNFSYHNRLLSDVRIIFRIITHSSLQKTNEGYERNDFIGERIKEIFDGQRGFGIGELIIKGQSDLSPLNGDYIVSELVFDTFTKR